MSDGGILVVDDEPQIRDLFTEALARHGHEAVGKGDGESALEYLARNDARAIFLDLKLPGANGVQVLEQIRESHPTVPVIVITAYPRDLLVDSAIRLGAFACLIKPFGMADVLAILEALELERAA